MDANDEKWLDDWLNDINELCCNSLTYQARQYIINLISNQQSPKHMAKFFPCIAFSIIQTYFSFLGFEISRPLDDNFEFHTPNKNYIIRNVLSEIDVRSVASKYEKGFIVVFSSLQPDYVIPDNIEYISETHLIGMVDFLFAQNEEKYLSEILSIFSTEIRQKIDLFINA